MAVSIAGMQAAIGTCSSLQQYERSLYTSKTCQGGNEQDPAQVAIRAFQDADLSQKNHLIFINTPHPDLLELPIKLGLHTNQYESILPAEGTDYAVLMQVERLIQENSDRKVLLTITSGNYTVSLMFTHPDQNFPSYAVLEPIKLNDSSSSAPTSKKFDSIAYLSFSQGLSNLDQNQFQKLSNLFSASELQPTIALGSNGPDPSSRNGLENILRIALIINRKLIPAASAYLDQEIKPPVGNPFYIPDETRPWLDQGPDSYRSALLVVPGKEKNTWDYWLLSEPDQPKSLQAVRPSLKGTEPYLVPITGKNISDLQGQLEIIISSLDNNTPLEIIAHNAYTKFIEGKSSLICSLIGATKEDLLKEIHHAKEGITKAKKTNSTWTSPKGSYFTPNPLGKSGIGFVYPGAFNSYPGMAQNLFDYFPVIHLSTKEIIKNISHSLSENFLFPRSLHSNPGTSNADVMTEFYNHPSELIESGISMSVLLTSILKDIFKVKPAAALGYSLGEMSMLWANGVWQDADSSSKSWQESTLFSKQLFGEMSTLREYWPDQQLQTDFWGSYILKAPIESVQDAIQKENQAFLTIVNTPNEIVIAGENEACQRVIADLACHALPMPFNASIHNPGMAATYPDFVELYTNDVKVNNDMLFYSASEYKTLDLNTDSLAQAMAKMTCNPVNFPALVSKAYQDGIRIFIEVGPQKTCSRWIDRILKSKEYAVIPLNKKHQSDYEGVLKVLSLLTSHHVPMDLSPLYPNYQNDSATKSNGTGNYSSRRKSSPNETLRPSSKKPTFGKRIDYISQGIPSDLNSEYLKHLSKLSSDVSKSHQEYLGYQGTITRNISKILALQTGLPPKTAFLNTNPPPLYNKDQIIAFTVGDHRQCFGDLFADFEDRRIPRLPNGPLRFIDRVLEINGTEGAVINGSNIRSEVDIPTHDWYLTSGEETLPYVNLMEIALQPCGFLSAYMGSIKDKSDLDLYFRNLDGEFSLVNWPKITGNTITNRVELISSTNLQNVIIQEYSFELFTEGKSFFHGKSSFGYFPHLMLKDQSGLDGAQTVSQWIESNPNLGQWIETEGDHLISSDATTPQLPKIPRIWISETGGTYKKGYLYTRLDVPSSSWFYEAHFYQDPVMPGSLGVEAMVRTIISSSATWGIPSGARWRIIPGKDTNWKYRGEITTDTSQVILEIHIKEIISSERGWQIVADGNLWKENTRIYQIDNISLETY